jgi:hypothetical protein
MKWINNLIEKYKVAKEIKWLSQEGLSFDDDIFHRYVPDQGKADTILGEIARGIGRLQYRWHNDGDVYFLGYGRETCGGDAHYLSECKIKGIRNLFPNPEDYDYPMSKERYEKFLNNLTEEFMKALKNKELLKELLQKNDVDGRDLDEKFAYDVSDDVSEVYIIANTNDGSTLMIDDTFEEDWSKCCENAYEVRIFDTEREAYNCLEENFKYINGDIDKPNPIYKDLDVEKMYYSDYGNGLLSENKSELLDDMENKILKADFY